MIQVDTGKIREARLRAGLRHIIHAASRTGLDYKTIEAYEGHNGSTPPKNPAIPTLRKIASAYGCTIRDLVANPEEVDRLIADLGGEPQPAVPAASDTEEGSGSLARA